MNLNLPLPFLMLILPMLLTRPAYSQITNVWALGDGEKVYRYDLAHPDKDGNFTWHDDTIFLKGLYNEVLAFQVIVETGHNSVQDLAISVNDPVHRPSGKTIGGNSLKYGPAGTIEVFSEHYLHVTNPTKPNWYYGSPAAAPEDMTGWIPDALIPANAISGRGGLPVDIGPGQNQGFWIDVSLPRDQEAYPSGIYLGAVEVYRDKKVVATIPLKIMVLPQYLPEENRTNIWVYSSSPKTLQSYFPG